MMKIAIFDRDGTLNPLGDDYLSHPDQWQPLPGALQAVAQLNRAGWHTVVACNQPGLGGGLLDASTLNAIHAKLLRQLSAQGGRMDALFSAPTWPTTPAAAACPRPACWRKSPSATASSRATCMWWPATRRCCTPPPPWAAATCTWCAAAKAPTCNPAKPCHPSCPPPPDCTPTWTRWSATC